MHIENLATAQVEILRDIFGFEDIGGDGPEAFRDPTLTGAETTPAPVVSARNAETDLLSRSSARAELRPVIRSGWSPADDVALGFQRPKTSEDGQLVALYQRPGMADNPLLTRIKERFGDEVDIRYCGRVRAQHWYRGRNDPLLPGVSLGHPDVTAGTLGCFATDDDSGALGVLSNNHVLANVNAASIGDAIRQPGTLDGGAAADRIGQLERFVPLGFGNAVNRLDCAWARLDGSRRHLLSEIRDSSGSKLGDIARTQPVTLSLLDDVQKIGRTTGHSHGVVTAINVVNLKVDMGGGLVSRFDGITQIEATGSTAFSDGGDSGSLILDDAFAPAALLFAGSKSGGAGNLGLTFACDLGECLTRLGITLAI